MHSPVLPVHAFPTTGRKRQQPLLSIFRVAGCICCRCVRRCHPAPVRVSRLGYLPPGAVLHKASNHQSETRGKKCKTEQQHVAQRGLTPVSIIIVRSSSTTSTAAAAATTTALQVPSPPQKNNPIVVLGVMLCVWLLRVAAAVRRHRFPRAWLN